jgi:PAS domain S-box-containing protein
MLAAIATILVAFLFEPLRRRIQVSLDKVFYRDRYSFRRTLVDFSHELNVESDLGALVDKVLTQVRETLNLAEVALFSPQGESGRLVALQSTHPQFGAAAALSSELGRLLLERSQQRDALVYEDPQFLLDSYPEDAPLLRALDIRCFIPFKVKQQTIALLALGRKRSGDFVNSEDLELLQTLANHAAMAMENARLYQNLRGQVQTVERLKEYNVNIVESIDVGVLVLDLDNQVTGWNRSLEQITKVPRQDAVGRPLDALFDADFVSAVAGLTHRSRFEPKEIFHLYRHPLRTRDGQSVIANLSIAPLIGQEQETYGTVVILADISERVKLEDQLVQSEKLASIGMLAAGVAHEVNTPLTGISSYAQLLLQKYPAEHPDRKVLERIESQTFRASRIVNALLNLARQKQSELAPLDLHMILAETLALLEHELKKSRVKVARELAADLPAVLGDSNKLQQVFLNLILNSRDAMPEGGTVTLRTRFHSGRVEVEVADTGAGIPPEALPKIYDPFFTTKRIGEGTGLGLALSYGIVRDHGGTIEVESEVGRGTTMTLNFPPAPMRRGAKRPLQVAHAAGREAAPPAALSAKPSHEG